MLQSYIFEITPDIQGIAFKSVYINININVAAGNRYTPGYREHSASLDAAVPTGA